MKKIMLLEDRFRRQETFLSQNNISLAEYDDILDNYVGSKADEALELIFLGTFNFQDYDVIVCHKSVQYKNENASIISNLTKYCHMHKKTLVLFSGGTSINYYNNSNGFEHLSLNSKTFYSRNLTLFLDAVRDGGDNILMLSYGEYWKQNIVANSLELTNLFLFDIENGIKTPSEFTIDNELYQIQHMFHNLKEKTYQEIVKFKESLEEYFNCIDINYFQSNSLLIHHDNICELKSFTSSIKFREGNEDIDLYISTDIIKKELAEKDFDRIFIKDNLSSNYLDLYGLRVAYHIRLSIELGDKSLVPIVIISDFDSETLNKFSQEANILFTDGIFLCKNTRYDIEKFQSLNLKALRRENFDIFLSKIFIEKPKDITGSHDVANQWSIYKWAELIKYTNETISLNRLSIDNLLYYKYLRAKFLHSKNVSYNINKPLGAGKVLLIDDEWNHGWNDILKAIIQNDKISFNTFEYNYQDVTKFNLYLKITNKIQEFNPDTIILDLRLLDSDHDNNDIDSYTGIKILKKIHEINKGIQVVMLTASSRSSILESLYEKKILGYIKKEHPNDMNIDTAENINKLVQLVDSGLNRKYLKNVYLIQNSILELDLFKIKFSFDMNDKSKRLLEIKGNIERVFEILDSNIPKSFIYCMLTIYKCIEIINDYYIYEVFNRETNNNQAFWNKNNILIDNNGNASVRNKIISIIRLLGIDDNEIIDTIKEITCTRNFEIHAGEIRYECEPYLVKTITDNHILRWFNMLSKILLSMDHSIV